MSGDLALSSFSSLWLLKSEHTGEKEESIGSSRSFHTVGKTRGGGGERKEAGAARKIWGDDIGNFAVAFSFRLALTS